MIFFVHFFLEFTLTSRLVKTTPLAEKTNTGNAIENTNCRPLYLVDPRSKCKIQDIRRTLYSSGEGMSIVVPQKSQKSL